MRALLIQPPFHRQKGMDWSTIPLGLGYLSAVLNHNGHECHIYNGEASTPEDPGVMVSKYMDRFGNYDRYLESLKDSDHYVWKEAAKYIKDYHPQLVGITFTSPAYESAMHIARIVKTLYPDVPVVVGGPHVTCLPDKVLTDYKAVDYCIVGEGEEPFLALVNHLACGEGDLPNIPGLVYRRQGKIAHGPKGGRIKSIEKLPYPERDRVLNGSISPTVVGSRGCPFKCSFCSSRNVWGQRVSIRPPEDLFEEMMLLKTKYRFDDIYIYDDTFTANRKRVFHFCKLMRDAGIPFTWSCSTRVDRVDDEMIKELKVSGCTMVSLGAESGDEELLKAMNKDVSLEDIKKASDIFERNEMPYGAFFIFGHPDETLESMDKTFAFMRSLKAQYYYLTVLTPYPGTPLLDELQNRNILGDDVDWKYYSTESPHRILVQKMPVEAFWKKFREIADFVDNVNRERLGTKAMRYLKFAANNAFKPGVIINKLYGRCRRLAASFGAG